MNGTRMTQSLQEIAGDHVPATLDLWPRVAARLEGRQRPPASLLGSRRVRLAVCAVICALIVGVPIAAQGTGGFFGVTLIDRRTGTAQNAPLAFPTPTPAMPRPSVYCPDCTTSPVSVQPLTVAEAQQRVPFPIRMPAWLPAGFGNAVVYRAVAGSAAGPATVTIGFSPVTDGRGTISLDEIQGTQRELYGIDSAQAQAATVNGHPAIYAHGTWQKDPATGHIPTDRPSQWDAAADAGILAWAADGVTYVLRCEGTGLDREMMIRIAESIR